MESADPRLISTKDSWSNPLIRLGGSRSNLFAIKLSSILRNLCGNNSFYLSVIHHSRLLVSPTRVGSQTPSGTPCHEQATPIPFFSAHSIICTSVWSNHRSSGNGISVVPRVGIFACRIGGMQRCGQIDRRSSVISSRVNHESSAKAILFHCHYLRLQVVLLSLCRYSAIDHCEAVASKWVVSLPPANRRS
jgi:hypothetical protein